MIRKADKDSPVAITANRLTDGTSVWLAPGNQWSEQLTGALVAHTDDERAVLLAAAEEAVKSRQIIGPYAMPVSISKTGIQPVSWREIIRANGPTIQAGAA